MRKRLIIGVLTAVVGTGSSPWAQTAAPEPPARCIVTLQPGISTDALAKEYGLVPRFKFNRAMDGFVGQISSEVSTRLQADPRIAAVTRDQVMGTFSAEETDNESGLSQDIPPGISRVGATPGTVSYTGEGAGVAVLDTGLDFHHRDLAPLGEASFWIADYGTSAQDDNGHGTHVGGIIAARDNDWDVVGVAPKATLYAVKVLDKNGLGYDSDIIAGLEWVLANGAALNPPIQVVNLSLGRRRCAGDGALHAAVAKVVDSGITVVVAAGNDPQCDVRDMVPAGFPEVIAVGSTTAETGEGAQPFGSIGADTVSIFTVHGAMDTWGTGVAISAPGEEKEEVDATGWVSSMGIRSTKLGGGTTRMFGTSMAAPHVTGVVALLIEQNPRLLPVDAKIKVMHGTLINSAPLDGRTSNGYSLPNYVFDGDREGILWAPEALSAP